MYIRDYRDEDTQKLRYICMETAFEEYRRDPVKRESVPIMFLDYFIEQEPELVSVLANDQDEAVGYIICSRDYDRFCSKMRGEYRDRLLEKAPGEVGFLDGFLPALEKIKDKPTHLHIDLLPEAQHQGWGKKLIRTLAVKLQERGEQYLSICCNGRGSDGYPFYRRLGFYEIYDYGNDVVSLTLNLKEFLEKENAQ